MNLETLQDLRLELERIVGNFLIYDKDTGEWRDFNPQEQAYLLGLHYAREDQNNSNFLQLLASKMIKVKGNRRDS